MALKESSLRADVGRGSRYLGTVAGGERVRVTEVRMADDAKGGQPRLRLGARGWVSLRALDASALFARCPESEQIQLEGEGEGEGGEQAAHGSSDDYSSDD